MYIYEKFSLEFVFLTHTHTNTNLQGKHKTLIKKTNYANTIVKDCYKKKYDYPLFNFSLGTEFSSTFFRLTYNLLIKAMLLYNMEIIKRIMSL